MVQSPGHCSGVLLCLCQFSWGLGKSRKLRGWLIFSMGECKRELGCEHHSSASIRLGGQWARGVTHTNLTPKWKLHRSNYVGKNDYQWLPTTRIYGKHKTQEWSWKWLGLKFLDLTTLWGSGFRLVRPLDVGNQSKTIGPPRGRRTLESRSLCGALVALFRTDPTIPRSRAIFMTVNFRVRNLPEDLSTM
jgi:hypothetical protein